MNKKSVKFSDELESIAIMRSNDIKTISSLFDNKRSVAKRMWYSNADLAQLKFQNCVIAHKFLTGKLREAKNQQDTFRGLELYDENKHNKSLEVISLSISAVLEEQIRQNDMGINDPAAIANAYRSAGAIESQKEATRMGHKDHKTSIQSFKSIGCSTSNMQSSSSADDDVVKMIGSFLRMSDYINVERENRHSASKRLRRTLRRLFF